MDAHAGNELFERKGLGEVVVRTEAEAAQLRRQVGARGEDEDGQLRPCPPQFREQSQPVDPRQEQVEQDEVVLRREREAEAGGPVLGAVHDETLGLQSFAEEFQDPRLILDDEHSHVRIAPSNL